VRLFNAFQIVAAFVAWPFGIAWLAKADFPGAGPAFFAACALYLVAFAAMTNCVYSQIEKD
jgi:hypothetical protein